MKIICYGVVAGDVACFRQAEKELNVELVLRMDPLNEENIEDARGCDAVSVTVSSVVPEDRMRKFAAMGVRFVTARSVGYNYIDLETAKECGIRVCHTPYSEHCVADFALMLMLMTVRKAKYILQKGQNYDYTVQGMRGLDMPNLTVGIIGTGRIGKAVAERIRGFGSKIIAYDLYPNDSLRPYVDYVSLDELFAQSDVITLHAPATKENAHLVNKDTIAKMKDGVLLVNTARGDLVHTEDLIEALSSGKVGGAGLDCFEGELGLIRTDVGEEMKAHKHILLLQGMSNVVLTPHVAYYTDQTRNDLVYDNITYTKQMDAGEEIRFEIKI